ncbi:hypothetical protein D9758_003115 [Tetrapyrgos nigripes]|uniref:Uncharacterized protein n=1 Tax=Tetrapyrgos nigripes TaxID=182062 RepID=A0A8H5GQA0_9AGAR|nr:hypothetical protein D9758_003115 [Tetrapyrgos nigripes]
MCIRQHKAEVESNPVLQATLQPYPVSRIPPSMIHPSTVSTPQRHPSIHPYVIFSPTPFTIHPPSSLQLYPNSLSPLRTSTRTSTSTTTAFPTKQNAVRLTFTLTDNPNSKRYADTDPDNT